MASKFRKKGGSKGLLKRTQESFSSRDSSGKFRLYIIDDLPLPKWKCKGGDHIIDIIPFLAGSMHPTVDEGEPAYLVDVWVHQKIGPTEDQYVCPARNYGKPCPICEYIAEQKKQDDYDEKHLKSIDCKRRVLYNIVCYDTGEEEKKGVQIWEASHWLTEKNFTAVAKNKRTGGYTAFACPDEGKSISFERTGQGANTKHEGVAFEERGYEISDDLLEAAATLDELLDLKSYEELQAAFYTEGMEDDPSGESGASGDDGEYSEPASRGRGSSRVGGRKRVTDEHQDEGDAPKDDHKNEEKPEEEPEPEPEPEEEPAEEKSTSRRSARGGNRRASRSEKSEDAGDEKKDEGARSTRRRSRRRG